MPDDEPDPLHQRRDVPRTARPLRDLGITDTKGGPHSAEPCHAVLIRRSSWADRLTRVCFCTQPKRHRPATDTTPAASPITVARAATPSGPRDDSHTKRRARLARLAAGTEMSPDDAEIEANHSPRRGVTAWYQLLIDHGWQPDEWTAERLAEAARRAELTDTNEGHDDEPSSQGDNDTVGAHILFPNPLHQFRR